MVFDTVNSVSMYLQDNWYDDQFEDDWDAEDMGCEQPTKNDFGVDNIVRKLMNRHSVELYGPYSKHHVLVLDQVILSK